MKGGPFQGPRATIVQPNPPTVDPRRDGTKGDGIKGDGIKGDGVKGMSPPPSPPRSTGSINPPPRPAAQPAPRPAAPTPRPAAAPEPMSPPPPAGGMSSGGGGMGMSDINLKDNIQLIDNALNRLFKINLNNGNLS